jgi:hypothetical protein
MRYVERLCVRLRAAMLCGGRYVEILCEQTRDEGRGVGSG